MKKILIIPVLALLAIACQKEPFFRDRDNEYLVYTSPGEDVDFKDYQTFYIADSVLVIGQSAEPEYSQSTNAKVLIEAYKDNMEKCGYVYTTSRSDADLGIQLTYMVQTEKYVQYYNDPYWWLDYPGYWSPGFWGDWYGYYYHRPIAYVYSTNSLVADMVDLSSEVGTGRSLEVVWTSYIGGPAGPNITYDVQRMQVAIDQAFEQSEYLKKTSTR